MWHPSCGLMAPPLLFHHWATLSFSPWPIIENHVAMVVSVIFKPWDITSRVQCASDRATCKFILDWQIHAKKNILKFLFCSAFCKIITFFSILYSIAAEKGLCGAVSWKIVWGELIVVNSCHFPFSLMIHLCQSTTPDNTFCFIARTKCYDVPFTCVQIFLYWIDIIKPS